MITLQPVLSALVALATLLPAAAAADGTLEARTDRTSLRQGESTTLLLRHRGGPAGRPDLAPLTADFEVLGTREVNRTTIVNGRRDATHDFMVTLAPRRTGTLTVPALTVGDATSAPFTLEVGAADAPALHGSPADGPAPEAPVFVELSADSEHPYVQGQVLVTARLYADASVQRGALGTPEPDGALVEQLGEDRSFDTTLGGKPYTVIERDYAVFPQRSGPLVIPPIRFEGSVAERRRRGRSPFDDFGGGFDDPFGGSLFAQMFDGGRSVRVASNALTLEVQAKPDAAAADWWLPARKVVLVDEWDPAPPVFRVGEQLVRTVALQALGLSGTQLPVPVSPDVDGLRQYADPPRDDTVSVGGEIAAVKLQRIAMIPTRPGPLTLPALEVAWWDTTADTARVARLPARTVEVLPGLGAMAQADPAGAAPSDTTGSAPAAAGADTTTATPAAPGPSPLVLWSVAGLGLAFLGIVGACLRRRTQRMADPVRGAHTPVAPPRLGAAEQTLRQACRAHDPAAARAALTQACRALWPEVHLPSAGALATRLGHEPLAQRIEELQRALYSPDASSWSGSALWSAYLAARRTPTRRGGRRHTLPALYPG